MTPEEYERFKEAEKQHLRKLKELKKAVGNLEREKSIRTAFENVRSEPADMLNKQKDLVDQLAIETARHEARLEMALESSEEAAREAQAAGLEEELQRDRAQALVKQLKRELKEGDEMAGVTDEEVHAKRQDQGGGNTTLETTTDEGGAAKKRHGGENEKRRDRRKEHDRHGDGSGTAKVAENPTSSRGDRPEKTIGRM
jgi:hypothetical protein